MKDIECPYCQYQQDICHDDGFGYEEGVLHQMECGECQKSFVFETSVSFYYDPKPADCLNEGKHDWQPTNSYPTFLREIECSMCGTRRKPTDQEKSEFNIPSYEEYIQQIKNNKS